MKETKKNLQEYNRAYYQKNREKLAKYRKEKWASDASYRERAKSRKERYKNFRAPYERRVKEKNLPRIILINGAEELVYSVNYASKFFKVHTMTIRRWARKGFLPFVEDILGKVWIPMCTLSFVRGKDFFYPPKKNFAIMLKKELKKSFKGGYNAR